MKTSPSLVTLAMTLALGFPIFAQTPPPATPPPQGMCPMVKGRPGLLDRMAAQLKLSDEQKASLKVIQAKHQDNLASKGKAAREAGKAFFEALKKPDSSPDTLRTLNRKFSELRLESMLERRAMRKEIRDLLNPDQREEAARMEGRMEGMRMARGGGMGMRGGMWGDKMGPGMGGGRRRWADQGAPDAAPVNP